MNKVHPIVFHNNTSQLSFSEVYHTFSEVYHTFSEVYHTFSEVYHTLSPNVCWKSGEYCSHIVKLKS